MAGKAARRQLESSPSITARLISQPMTRKNSAISPSLIQWSTVLSRSSGPRCNGMAVAKRISYQPASGLLATTSASTAASSSSTPAADSSRMNSRIPPISRL